MSYKMSFQERAKLSMEMLSKQSPITLKEAREQVNWLNSQSSSESKKQKS